jgi:hypothetical protein
LRGALDQHVVSTAYELGWAEFKNGDLLNAAENQFDLLGTTDKNLRYQQNLVARRLAILVLPYASWPKLQKHLEKIAKAVEMINPNDYIELIF